MSGIVNICVNMLAAEQTITIVTTKDAPSSVGHYSQAVKCGDLVFISGSLGLHPQTMQLVRGGVEAQTEQAMKNMKAIVEASGTTLGKVVKTTLFLKSMNDYPTVNAVYARFFGDHKPAQSTVEIARLPIDAHFKIECIASLKMYDMYRGHRRL